MKHIGVAGVTIPGSLLCIDTIVAASYAHFGADSGMHPEITYTNPSLHEIDQAILDKNWNLLADDLVRSVGKLAGAGADFAIIPANSAHYAIDEVTERSPIPVMNIVEETVAECQRRGFQAVGILGVGVTMSDGLYEAPLRRVDIRPVLPSIEDQLALDALIYRDIIHGTPTQRTHDSMYRFIEHLRAQGRGCDSFIAGCTEIPVVITSEADSPLPFVDTTRLLARQAFQRAIG